jgi:hypothetical protein
MLRLQTRWILQLPCFVSYRFVTELKVRVKDKVMLRPTVSRPVCVGVRPPSGALDQLFFLLEIFFSQLLICYYVAPSQTRERVCNLQLLLGLASTVPLGCAFRGNHDQMLLSQVWDSPQCGGPGSRKRGNISPWNRAAQLYPPPPDCICPIHLHVLLVTCIVLHIQYTCCAAFSPARYSRLCSIKSRTGYNGNFCYWTKVEVNIRPTVSRRVCYGV